MAFDIMAPYGLKIENEPINPENVFNESIMTDVEGLTSDAVYRKGSVDFPVFDVTEKEFFNNMSPLRQRNYFTTKKVSEYQKTSRYRNPFYIRYKNEEGKEFIRRIK